MTTRSWSQTICPTRNAPGLRVISCDDTCAKMHWLGAATPVELHLTRQLS